MTMQLSRNSSKKSTRSKNGSLSRSPNGRFGSASHRQLGTAPNAPNRRQPQLTRVTGNIASPPKSGVLAQPQSVPSYMLSSRSPLKKKTSTSSTSPRRRSSAGRYKKPKPAQSDLVSVEEQPQHLSPPQLQPQTQALPPPHGTHPQEQSLGKSLSCGNVNESRCSRDDRIPIYGSHNANKDDRHQFDHQQMGQCPNLEIASQSRISVRDSREFSQQHLQRALNRSYSPEVLERSIANRDKKEDKMAGV